MIVLVATITFLTTVFILPVIQYRYALTHGVYGVPSVSGMSSEAPPPSRGG